MLFFLISLDGFEWMNMHLSGCPFNLCSIFTGLSINGAENHKHFQGERFNPHLDD